MMKIWLKPQRWFVPILALALFCNIMISDRSVAEAAEQNAYQDGYVSPEEYEGKNDTERFQKMFNDISDGTVITSIAKENSWDAMNISAPVCVLQPGKTYYIDDTVKIAGGFVKIIGNGAKIVSDNSKHVFEFDTGWQTQIDNVEFVKCKEPVYFVGRNREAGKIIITNCRFYNCTGYAIVTNRRSCTVTVKDNDFIGCERYWWSNSTDLSVFEHNWAKGCVLSSAYPAPIRVTRTSDGNEITGTETDEFTCRINNNVFIADDSSEPNGRAWIETALTDMIIEGNRFGGTTGNLAVVNTMPGMTVNKNYQMIAGYKVNVNAEKTTGIRLLNNYTVSNNAMGMINLNGLPNLVEITGNRGFDRYATLANWDSSVSADTQSSLISAREFIKFVIFGNSGHNLDKEYYDFKGYKSSVPSNLQSYVNTIFDSSSNLSGNAAAVMKLQNENGLLNEQISQLQTDNADLQANINELTPENRDLKSEVSQLQSEADQLKSEIQELKARLGQ